MLRMRRAGEGWKKQSLVTLPAEHALALGVDLTQRFQELLTSAEPDDDEPDRLSE